MTETAEKPGESEEKNFLVLFHDARVSCGFPYQGADALEERLDLNWFISHPAATFVIRAGGDSLIERLIDVDTFIIYDRMIRPKHGDLAYVLINGEECIREICYRDEKLYLRACNENYADIEINEEIDLQIRGTVIASLTLQYKQSPNLAAKTETSGKKQRKTAPGGGR